MSEWKIDLKECFGEIKKPSKRTLSHIKKNKSFLMFTKWKVRRLKLSTKNTQVFRGEVIRKMSFEHARSERWNIFWV
jgi:hypothetical protein